MRSKSALSWAGTLLLLGGLGVLVGVGITYAHSSHSTARKGLPSIGTSSRHLAAVNYQSQHLFAVRHGHAGVQLGEPAIRIRIPAIGVDAPVITTAIVDNVWQTADWAVGYMQGSAYPGTCSFWGSGRNCATDLAAHDDIKGEIFKNIGSLRPGDRIYLYTAHSVFTYSVTGQQTVDPNDGNVLYSSHREVNLVSCTPYWVDSQRIVVSARLKSRLPRFPSGHPANHHH